MRFFATRQLSVAEADAAVHDVPDAEQAVPQNAAGPPADRDAALRMGMPHCVLQEHVTG